MKKVNKSISILLIFLMIINTSCYTIRTIKKEEIKSGQQLIVTQRVENATIALSVIAEKVTEDTLFCKSVSNEKMTIPMDSIKSVTNDYSLSTIEKTVFIIVAFVLLFSLRYLKAL